MWTRDDNKQYCKEWKKSLKKLILGWYGGECVCCHETEIAFLTLDHIFDDGERDGLGLTKLRHLAIQDKTAAQIELRQVNKRSGFHLYGRIKKLGFENRPCDLQVLCFNCQWGKRINKGFCPHHPDVDLRQINQALATTIDEALKEAETK